MYNMPRAIHITISYDPNLQKITGKESETSMSSEGVTFQQFLFFLFSSYSEIQSTYPPGKLGFLLNGEPPRLDTILRDGDRLLFVGTGEDGVTRTPWEVHSTQSSSQGE